MVPPVWFVFLHVLVIAYRRTCNIAVRVSMKCEHRVQWTFALRATSFDGLAVYHGNLLKSTFLFCSTRFTFKRVLYLPVKRTYLVPVNYTICERTTLLTGKKHTISFQRTCGFCTARDVGVEVKRECRAFAISAIKSSLDHEHYVVF